VGVVIALAVYAAVVTVLLIVAVCFLVVLVREQKEIVRRAVDARTAKVAAIASGTADLDELRAAFGKDPLTADELAAFRRALDERTQRRNPGEAS
jgi:hypothetical protein